MGRASPSKTVDVVDHTRRVYPILLQTLFQKVGGMDTLAAGEHLLTADEEIKRIADFL
jgi:hypothetical protein